MLTLKAEVRLLTAVVWPATIHSSGTPRPTYNGSVKAYGPVPGADNPVATIDCSRPSCRDAASAGRNASESRTERAMRAGQASLRLRQGAFWPQLS
ncbi:MAG TPA: hypothetical protein VFQ44_15165 [Streptosporangiaceae bacterium]|nr:hypothetical protein [Streptosporangiaceae bacterium]